jgi:hypothetical protein
VVLRKSGLTSEKTAAKKGDEDAASPNAALFDNPRRNCSFVAFIKLKSDKDGNQNSKDHKESDDLAVLPGILAATPLQSKEYANNSGNEDGCTFEIHKSKLLFPGESGDVLSRRLWILKEEQDEGDGHGPEGKVDVETLSSSQSLVLHSHLKSSSYPSPRHVVRENSSEEGSHH